MSRLAGCLLVLLASSAAVALAADDPANVQAETAATRCVYLYGPDGCKSGAACAAVGVDNCLQCQKPDDGYGEAAWECTICQPGYFKTAGDECHICPQGAWCAGSGINWCDADGNQRARSGPGASGEKKHGSFVAVAHTPSHLTEGLTTAGPGMWSASQCDACLPGYSWERGLCERCHPGEVKTSLGTTACTTCPTGTVPNAGEAATACVAPADCPDNSAPKDGQGPCTCITPDWTLRVTGNEAVFGEALTHGDYSPQASIVPSPWPIGCREHHSAAAQPSPTGPTGPAHGSKDDGDDEAKHGHHKGHSYKKKGKHSHSKHEHDKEEEEEY